MSESKFSGGMGFHDFKVFNIAKQGWRLTLNPLSFWGRLLEGIYFLNPLSLELQRGGVLPGSGLFFSKGETSSFKDPDGKSLIAFLFVRMKRWKEREIRNLVSEEEAERIFWSGILSQGEIIRSSQGTKWR
ncbi:hypothetical protein RHSIM_Rhsim03G0039400 [Rhododendron simsii]|uniref:Uncharacterized protein n=1 Tax=Rhododendron simsii TaxID=118357 RepID=A0A834H7L8_RHOSS|nr:hypothetical protein RHSIM_Rhsim03G0039400 [Rhododendron simsii]